MIKDKITIVTGASSGIGEATARSLAKEGAKVVLVARRKDRIDTLAKEIEKTGGTVWAIATDINDRKNCEEVVKQVKEKWTTIDILVNNAGVMLLGPAIGAPIEEWEEMVKVNLLALMYMTHEVLPIMKEKNSGHIINVSSVAGRTTSPISAVYNATKWGVNAFTEALRQEFSAGKLAIRTTIIEPGAVITELASHNRPEIQEGMKERFAKMKRLEVDDIARSIIYAVSQPAHVNVNEILIRPTDQPN